LGIKIQFLITRSSLWAGSLYADFTVFQSCSLNHTFLYADVKIKYIFYNWCVSTAHFNVGLKVCVWNNRIFAYCVPTPGVLCTGLEKRRILHTMAWHCILDWPNLWFDRVCLCFYVESRRAFINYFRYIFIQCYRIYFFIFALRVAQAYFDLVYCICLLFVVSVYMLQPICEISRFMKWLIFLAFSWND